MASIIEIIAWEVRLLLFALFAIVVLQLLTGQINVSGLLLRKEGDGAFSPERVQLLLATIASAFQYLSLVLKDHTHFPINAHYSNVSKGESVNCQTPGIENNDIHIVLGQNSNSDDECSSVTAEISPHFRPDVWIPDNLNSNNARLFRFTGQLFFDAAHRPCVGGTGPNPKRISLFEIHPAYAVEICTDKNNSCTVDSDQNWVPLSDFVGSPAPGETRLRTPDDGFSSNRTLGA
jgi:hypothetical protein